MRPGPEVIRKKIYSTQLCIAIRRKVFKTVCHKEHVSPKKVILHYLGNIILNGGVGGGGGRHPCLTAKLIMVLLFYS